MLLLSLLSTPSLAQDTLEEVVVVAKRRTPLQYAPANVTVIDQQHITETLSADIRELVRYEPGVSVRNDAIRFGVDSFAIRGVGGDRIAAEVDGVGVAESFSIGAFADSGRVFTDMDFVRRVEILRGPASALYGSDAIGGVVRFETLDPSDVLTPGRAFAARVRTGYRGATDGWSASALTGAKIGGGEWLFGYVHRSDHEADTAARVTPNPRESASDQALVKWVISELAAGPMEIALETGRTRDETIVNALLGAPPRFVNTTAMRGDDRAQHVRLSIEQSLAFNASWFDEASWRVHAQRTDTEQLTYEVRRAAPPRTPATALQRTFTLEDEALGAEITALKSLQLGRWSHDLVYGVEVDVGRVEQVRDGRETNLDSGVVSATILGERFPLRDFPITERLEAGLYLQDEMRLADSRWRLTPGLRWDLYRLRPREDAIYREDNPTSRPSELDEAALTPKLAASYAFDEHTTAFAQYARGFRSPPFEDVNIGLEIPLFNFRALPNPELRPETSDAFELGVRMQSVGWRATLSTHYTEFDDFIESRVNLGRDPVTGTTLFQSRNVDRARMYGVEFAARVDLGAMRSSLDGWAVDANAAWSRGDNLVTDQPLNSVEPLKATLALDYEAPSGWGVRFVASGAATKDRLAEAAIPLYRTERYLTFDAFAHIALGGRGELNVGVANLTNERYIDWIDVRGRAADDPLVPYATHPGRNVVAGVSWTF